MIMQLYHCRSQLFFYLEIEEEEKLVFYFVCSTIGSIYRYILFAGNGIESETKPVTAAIGQDLLTDEIVSEHLTRYLLVLVSLSQCNDCVLEDFDFE